MGDKLKDLMRSYVGYLTVAVICLAYIATSFIRIEETGKTVERIVSDGMLYFILGILINRIFDAQGLMIGSLDPRVFQTMKRHNEVVDRVYPFMNHLDDWCEYKNGVALKRARRNYLSRFGMKYADYFDEDGTAREFKFKDRHYSLQSKLHEKIQYRRFRHAACMKLTEISAGLLISDAGDTEDPYAMGRNKPEYIKAATKKDIVVKSLTALLFGYYGVSLITDFNWANLIWMILQTGILIGMGVFSMQTAIIFVTEEYRGRIIKKIDLLEQFEVSIKEEERKNERNEEQEKEVAPGELPGNESDPESVRGQEITGSVLQNGAGTA